jgi:hypothetical protein
MNNATVVFDPDAATDLRKIVQTTVINDDVAITGQTEWYPVAFFLSVREWWGIGRFSRRYLGGLAARENTCGSRAGARAWLWQGVDEARGTLCGRARLHRCILDTFSFQARPFL